MRGVRGGPFLCFICLRIIKCPPTLPSEPIGRLFSRSFLQYFSGVGVNKYLAIAETLAQQARPAGGWGYAPGQEAHLEPTCLSLLALAVARDRFGREIASGQAFLDTCALADGSYRLARGRQEAVWPTSLVLFVRTALGIAPDQNQGIIHRLLSLRGRTVDLSTTDKPFECDAKELMDIDSQLVGWPWAEHNFSWVEPTAWACLALRAAGLGHHRRVQEGMKLLLDRAMDEGGVNCGARMVLGQMTKPVPGPTALMLLALQGQKHQRLDSAIGYLQQQLNSGDLEHLCWIKLALDVHRQQAGVAEFLPALDVALAQAFEAQQQIPWIKPSLVRLALAALALAVPERNFFRLSASQPPPPASDQGQGLPATDEAEEPPRPPLGQRWQNWWQGLRLKFGVRFLDFMRQPPLQSAVHIARANSYQEDLAGILCRQYAHFRERVPLKGKRVVLKPNMVEFHADKVINTNPLLVEAVIELCRREGAAEIIVAEGPGHWRNVEYLVAASGLGEVLKHHQVSFVDLNHDEPVKTPNLGRFTRLDYLFLAQTVARAEVLISLPKVKTHHWAAATLSLKNLFGILPGICYGWPKNELHWRGIPNSIIDIALTRTPELAIVDGIIGMEGDGPLSGTPKQLGALIMGCDLLAVDATCCRLMELEPEQIDYLVLGQMRRLGRLLEQDIPQLGETIASMAQPFAILPHFRKLCKRPSA